MSLLDRGFCHIKMNTLRVISNANFYYLVLQSLLKKLSLRRVENLGLVELLYLSPRAAVIN